MYKAYKNWYNKNVVLSIKVFFTISDFIIAKRGIKMKLNFDYKGKKITYNLMYKKTKVISINISKDGEVNVIAPIGTSVYAVMDKVKGNSEWIIGEIYDKSIASEQIELPEQYMYLGKNYKLQVVLNNEIEQITVKMLRGRLVVETNTQSNKQIRDAIVEWYKQKVVAKLKERIKVFKEEYVNLPTEVEVVDDKGVLLAVNKDTIRANVALGIAPADVIDYIVITGLNKVNELDNDKSENKVNNLIAEPNKVQKWLEDNNKNLML